MNPKVDKHLSTARNWPDEMKKLRTILLDCGLTEELKWGKPCYALSGQERRGNTSCLKEYCAVLFF